MNIVTFFVGFQKAVTDGIEYASSEAQMYHRRMSLCITGAIIVLVGLSIALNISGLKEANIFVLFFAVIALLFVSTWPSVIVGVNVADYVYRNRGSDDTLKLWAKFIVRLMLYVSLYLLFASIVPFWGNIMGVFFLLAVFIIITLMDYHWGICAPFAKWIVYVLVIAVMLFSFSGFISPVTWNSWVGFDVGSVFRVSEVQNNISKVYVQLEQDKKSEANKRVEIILDKIKNNQPLSVDDFKYLEEHNRSKVKSFGEGAGKIWKSTVKGASNVFGTIKESTGNVVGAIGSNIAEYDRKTSIRHRTASVSQKSMRRTPGLWKTVRVGKNPVALERIYNDDYFEYTSPREFRTKYDSGQGFVHNPSVQGNTRGFPLDDMPKKIGVMKIYNHKDNSVFTLRYRIHRYSRG